jgi:TetR/AcrR family transcriptional regulator, transcriptional repressor for nem operon
MVYFKNKPNGIKNPRYNFMDNLSKAQRTRKRIIEQSAPLFNSKGYAGTALSDILKATGLTKGGVYGNFSGKDEIALEAFEYNKDQLFNNLHDEISRKDAAVDQLHAFFRVHGLVIREIDGGCPILNTATEADDTHPELNKKAKAAVLVWINYLKTIIKKGIENKEIREEINPERYARMFISMLEGAVFMGKLTGDPEAYLEVTRHIRRVIDTELRMG